MQKIDYLSHDNYCTNKTLMNNSTKHTMNRSVNKCQYRMIKHPIRIRKYIFVTIDFLKIKLFLHKK